MKGDLLKGKERINQVAKIVQSKRKPGGDLGGFKRSVGKECPSPNSKRTNLSVKRINWLRGEELNFLLEGGKNVNSSFGKRGGLCTLDGKNCAAINERGKDRVYFKQRERGKDGATFFCRGGGGEGKKGDLREGEGAWGN